MINEEVTIALMELIKVMDKHNIALTVERKKSLITGNDYPTILVSKKSRFGYYRIPHVVDADNPKWRFKAGDFRRAFNQHLMGVEE